ncbi:heavy metal translocating P-type ATPase [Hyphobacterium marinum]|uniref:Heavy metal translocating P-type ATPase n=1 Tax=Hyphobacterium marinum TaxID=3116574 RepID=A0ABU7LU48_9PROT|nr:heavy metal translocating P-type ATPase [Hyphobacterium sp. Y6023]MEE2565072.1 heavy metal translocating P-type ATPase [Hyphobacterium sp. Y6023]
MAALDPAQLSSSDADPVAFVRPDKDGQTLDLMVSGAHCAGCIAKIESGLTAMDGVSGARLNLSTGRLALHWQGAPGRARDFVARLRELGYPAVPYAPEDNAKLHSEEETRLVRAMAVAGFAMANVMLLSIAVWSGVAEMDETTRDFMHWISAIIVLPSAAYAGRPFFTSAWSALRHRQVNMDVPISLAVILACGLSVYEMVRGTGDTYFDAAAMLLFFLLIGRFLDSRLRAKAGAAARGLAAMQAATANRIDVKGHVRAIPARDVRPGDRLVIAAGEKVPVDARIESGDSELDAALVTGETLPSPAGPGALIHSGMINLAAPLTVIAEARREDSLLAEIARLVEAGEQGRSRYVKLADRAARLYVPLVHGLAALTLVGWLIAGGDVRTAVVNAIAVLIITCPCALGLAVPAVQVVASGRLFRSGILVKSGDALERLAEADLAVFDKTGTLTVGRPRLLNADTLPEGALEAAARLARASRHPLSRAIADAAGMGETASDIREHAGGGLEGTVDGVTVRLGSARWLGVETDGAANAEVWLEAGDNAPIRFSFADEARGDARAALDVLKARGLVPYLISGDRREPVDLMADRLGIDTRESGLSPQDKIAWLNALKAEGHHPLMVGDGINDAPALAAAHVSISPASAADISQATADLVLQRDQLMSILEAVDVARAARRRVLENFGLAAVYNAIAVPLAVAGFVTPLIAAIAMSASSLLVTLNALRLARR